ncbi:hypothetical protein MSPP1_001218 [Malassezia sp. CBS 17886]|nr:hypothetical protein MSPP1_001218 [Malassezia sp. CBS 17886]
MPEFEKKAELPRFKERTQESSGRFVGKQDSLEDSLKLNTVGLVRLEDFQRKREQLAEEKKGEQARQHELRQQKRNDRHRKAKSERAKLSFALDDEDDNGGAPQRAPKRSRPSVKNPDVDTSFLPDRQRDEEEQRMREQLRAQWLEQQERLKAEEVNITYSYWDGTGHRNSVTCTKGDSIAHMLEKCRLQVPELRGVSVDNLMYIKEDLIIPHHYTFYDFIVSKARGKSGPLFHFDVHDDVRIVSDATVEKNESHAGKLVERSWYNRNKHIFPASRWEVYDPGADYGGFTVRDRHAV